MPVHTCSWCAGCGADGLTCVLLQAGGAGSQRRQRELREGVSTEPAFDRQQRAKHHKKEGGGKKSGGGKKTGGGGGTPGSSGGGRQRPGGKQQQRGGGQLPGVRKVKNKSAAGKGKAASAAVAQ